MRREIRCMSPVPALFRPASFRLAIVALVLGLLALPAAAQDLPAPKITGSDIRRALIWTGHLSVMKTGDPAAIFHSAMQSWQTSKGYKATDDLADEEVAELLAEGDKQRDSFGWAKLEDKSIGFSIGVPTKLVKFLSARTDNGNFWYDFEGGVRYTVGVDIAKSEAGKFGVLLSAMADSLSVSRHFNPTAIPRPKLEQPTPTAGDIVAVSAARPPAAKPAVNIDGEGKTGTIKRETRDGPGLTAEQVFDKVSPAVFVVTAGERMGSAVAISERELLTN